VSTFKDWTPSPAEIVEAFPRDLVEVALAHALDSKTVEAYRRTEMIEKRRRLLSRWSDYAPDLRRLATWCRWTGRLQPCGYSCGGCVDMASTASLSLAR
jgi:hypothetical protein